jgi:hypothetical protein
MRPAPWLDPSSDEGTHVFRRLPDSRDIRLVNIQPGRWGDPMQCSLSHHSLDERPDYSALSYVWGSPKALDSILLDGAPWRITVNLANALHFLRDPDRITRIWVDALVSHHDGSSQTVKMFEIGS